MPLRKELLWAIALKMVLLLSIKFAFFPHRLAADEAAQGVADRIAAQMPAKSESVQKETP
ncbi:MAG: cytochrome oxidase putative small subunit CydP [Betaproteobacteria bacterium]